MITHDVDEAIFLSDRIFLMTNGPMRASQKRLSWIFRDRVIARRWCIILTTTRFVITWSIFSCPARTSFLADANGAARAAECSGVEDGHLVLPPDVNPALT